MVVLVMLLDAKSYRHNLETRIPVLSNEKSDSQIL